MRRLKTTNCGKGFLVFLFAVSTTIIVGRHKRQGRSGNRLNKTLLAVSATMFILATIVRVPHVVQSDQVPANDGPVYTVSNL